VAGLMDRIRLRGRHAPGAPEEQANIERTTFVAAEYPRFDSGGRPIVEFSPDVRTALGLNGVRIDFALAYERQAAVRLCVDFLAENIAHCALKVYRKQDDGDREEVPSSHPLRRLLRNPNGGVSSYEFIRDTIGDLAIYGNAHWVRRQAGDAQALVRVHPQYVTCKGGSPVVGPTFYEVDVGGGPVAFAPAFMTHFRCYNPTDIRVGISVLESLVSIMAEERYASRHRIAFWRNSARHEGWISRPKEAGRWTRDQRREFRADWQEAMSGTENAGKTAVLEDDMKWNPGSFSPKDAEFIEGRDWGLDMTATAFRIPLAVLSRKNTATFASTKEFHTMVYVDTLGPWMAMMEQAINVQLVPWFGDENLFVEFNVDEKLQGDFETQSEAMRRAIHVPYMSVNEARKIRNLPRLEDPDFDTPAKLQTYTYFSDPDPQDMITEPATPPLRQAAQDQEVGNGNNGNGHGAVQELHV